MPVYDQYGRTDNYMTGPLPARSMGGGPVRGSKTDRGVRTEFVRPQNQATDQVAYKSSPGLSSRSVQTVAVDPFTGTPLTAGGMNSRDVIADIPGPAPMAPSPTINAATPLDGYRLALTPTPPPAAPLSPAVTAIETAAPPTAAPAQQPGLPMSERNPGDWQVRAWLDQASTMPSPAVNNPAAAPMMGNPQVAQAMAAKAPQAAPARISPVVHAALMAQQQRQSPAGQAAIDAGKRSYVVAKSRNGSENALMPTRTISGAIRNTYGD